MIEFFLLCSTIRSNTTYRDRKWLWTDPRVKFIEPKNQLVEWIDLLSTVYSGREVLFIIDDVIDDESLDKSRGPLTSLTIKGRHRSHSLWMLTQRYTKVPLVVRDQLKQLFLFYPKNRKEFDLVHEENDVIESKEEVNLVKKELKNKKHACLYLRLEPPRAYRVISS